MHLEKKDIENLKKVYRLNLINSISGIKPVNLVGTQSKDGLNNLAIISSVVHLGSNPAQLGFVMRPQNDGPKDTYTNIQETGFYTINHVIESFIKKAHYTSAKLGREESEFDRMAIKEEIIKDFKAPFVAESPLKMGMKHLESIPLPNGCIFIIGSVEFLIFPDDAVNPEGQIDLEAYSNVGIAGLNTYYKLEKLASYPFVRNSEIPDFK